MNKGGNVVFPAENEDLTSISACNTTKSVNMPTKARLPGFHPFPNPCPSLIGRPHCTACSLAVLPESWGFMTSGSSGGLEKGSTLSCSKASSKRGRGGLWQLEKKKPCGYQESMYSMKTKNWLTSSRDIFKKRSVTDNGRVSQIR